MSKRANPTWVGAFVLGAVGLAIVLLIVLGGGFLSTDYDRFVLFFEGSVNGLRVGAPVNFRGVKIGTVDNIAMQLDDSGEEILIPVYILLEQGLLRARDTGDAHGKRKTQQFIDALVARGLRGQLQMQSIVTGQLMVQFDFFPETEVRLTGFDPEVPELPTVPSPLGAITRKLEDLPIDTILERVEAITDGLDRIINSEEMGTATKELTAALTDLRQLMGEVRQDFPGLSDRLEAAIGRADELFVTAGKSLEELTPVTRSAAEQVERTAALAEGRPAELADELQKTAAAATATLQQTQRTLAAVEADLAGDSVLSQQIRQTLDELTKAARAVRSASSYLERHPEALIHGKGKGR